MVKENSLVLEVAMDREPSAGQHLRHLVGQDLFPMNGARQGQPFFRNHPVNTGERRAATEHITAHSQELRKQRGCIPLIVSMEGGRITV